MHLISTRHLPRWFPKHLTVPGLLILVMGACLPASGQQTHPHLLVSPGDRQAILDKIHDQAWARDIYESMVKKVAPYVERHEHDPSWILSRYLMNRVPGKRYTTFYSDPGGAKLVGYGGDAPVPTIRVSANKRGPITPDGHSYRLPSISELVPNDTSMLMRLQRDAPDSGWVLTDPKSFVGTLNGQINELALDAAILYWLTGKQQYATFAADILDQWVHGAFYQQPITGPCRTGYLDMQTLGDARYTPLVLAYDFLYGFLIEHHYDMSPYETVFDRIAHTMTFRGFVNNNWFAAQTPAMVTAALSLTDTARRNYYLHFYLEKDTIRDGCGHLAIPSMISRWLTPDGHWKETAGYHNYATGNFLISALIMERNGYPVFEKYPALFQASYVLLKYAFPNLKNPAFGDNGARPAENPNSLEIALVMASHQKDTALTERLYASMGSLLDAGTYRRSSSGYLGLLAFLPTVPKPSREPAPWPRSGQLDYAGLYLQRNGTDPRHGLMYVVQGATYNHNHANGMSMELYGPGMVMGADPGDGLNYDAPLHISYYAEWAAHNTVVTAEKSGPVPRFRGGGGAKPIGKISLVAMEPAAGAAAVSPYCSFTDTRYTDITTGSPEERTMGIVRLSDTTGYYVDIYRSANTQSNDYVYHNVGDSLRLLDQDRRSVSTHAKPFAVDSADHDPPGFAQMKDYRSTGVRSEGVIALFSTPSPIAGEPSSFMQVYLPGEANREYFTALAPPTRTAGRFYGRMRTPTLVVRQQGSAWERPFLAVYEPFQGRGGYAVTSVERLTGTDEGNFTALRVTEATTGQRQLIFESGQPAREFSVGDARFKGRYGVAAFGKDESLRYLYLGKGSSLAWKGFAISADGGETSCNLAFSADTITVSSLAPLTVTIRGKNITGVRLWENGRLRSVPVTGEKDLRRFHLPAVMAAKILVETGPR